MIRTLCLLLILGLSFDSSAQVLKSFSEDKGKFLSELDNFMNASKRKDLKAIFEEFKRGVQSGLYTDEQFTKIQGISNTMLSRKMRVTPYFQK